jgi:hypothetical protein
MPQIDSAFAAAQIQTALQAMRLLRAFDPRLAGPLAEMAPASKSPIILHVQADHSDDVRMYLDEQRIPARMLQTRLHTPRSASQPLPGLGFLAGDQEIVVWIFSLAQFRQRLRVGDESVPSQRLSTTAVERLLARLPAPPSAARINQ